MTIDIWSRLASPSFFGEVLKGHGLVAKSANSIEPFIPLLSSPLAYIQSIVCFNVGRGHGVNRC